MLTRRDMMIGCAASVLTSASIADAVTPRRGVALKLSSFVRPGLPYDLSNVVMEFVLPTDGLEIGINHLYTGQTIDWGDGTVETASSNVYATHTYAKSGTYYAQIIIPSSAVKYFDPVGGGSQTPTKNIKKYWTRLVSFGRVELLAALPFYNLTAFSGCAPINEHIPNLPWGCVRSCQSLPMMVFHGKKRIMNASAFSADNGALTPTRTDDYGNSYKFEYVFRDMTIDELFPTNNGFSFPFGGGVLHKFTTSDGYIVYSNGEWMAHRA